MSSAPLLLAIDQLCVSLDGREIIEKLALQVRSGEILGLVGASGSGKSTAALAIMQLLPARYRVSGTIHLRGIALTGKSETELEAVRGKDIGMIFQEPMTALNPLLTIGDQVAETIRLHESRSRSQANTMARAALDSVGLLGGSGSADRYPHQLSGGQRQRVAIAIAVVLRPSLLIADEPTTALDVITQAQVLALLRDLVRTRGMGLILVSHDLAMIAEVTDRIAVMHEGTIVDECETADASAGLRHPAARALLAAAALPPKRSPSPATEGTPVLEVSGVVREYPRRRRSIWHAEPAMRAVDGVSLRIHPGENVGLVGESGSGKTSLLRAILALERPQAGEVRLLGEKFSSAKGVQLKRLRRSIQAVFQDPFGSFDPEWPVERLIAEPFYLMDVPPSAAERKRKVVAVLEQVGLSASDLLRYSHEFSGGQRQRIAIARALVTEPAVIAFDEAVSALDAVVRAEIMQLLGELSSRLRLAYLFVSHDLNVVRAIADRVYVMQKGHIVEHGATVDVFSSPQHEYTRSLLAATPRTALR